MSTEAEEKLKEAEQKIEEAIRAALAQVEQMARKMAADMLAGKVDPQQMASILQGMMGKMPFQVAETPYRVLGLDPSADDDLVKLAYRTLSRKYHPDKGGSPEKMAEINRAYESIVKERGWQ
jgi:DnaJ-class molecular chaperone